MLQGYHRTLKSAARQSVFVEAFMPDKKLGVGPAEILKAVPPMTPKQPKTTIKAKMPKKSIIENLQIGGHGKIVDESSFPLAGYLGEGLGYGF
jgi:hypothetical protein